MNLLIKILKAAHCRSTHQHFVLDALPLVSTPRGQKLRQLLMHHHDIYLIGSKDPDKTFRDFRNHVLHVGDNGWGGATKAAEKWYRRLIQQLEAQEWEDVAYVAGVLSHYFTDPLMPLHTAQSERESVLHRPLEWSVTKSYAKICRKWRIADDPTYFQLPQGPGWLGRSITQGATIAHQHYEDLLDRYDFAAGKKNPPAGLDQTSIDIFSQLFGLAITGWAQVLERAADEARCEIPHAPLTMKTLVASIEMPSAWIVRRAESKEESLAIKAIFDEYQSTGKVVDHLPDEVVEVRAQRESDRVKENANAQIGQTKNARASTPRVRASDIVVAVTAGTRNKLERAIDLPPVNEEPVVTAAAFKAATAPAKSTTKPVTKAPKIVPTAPTDKTSPPDSSVSFADRDQIREKFDAAMTEARQNPNSDRNDVRRQRAALNRIELARQRRNQARKTGHLPGQPTATTQRPTKRKLAVPTVPTQVESTRPSVVPMSASSASAARNSLRTNQNRVGLGSDLVDAPSIGPKTAKRFARIGIHTIGQFLEADPTQMADALATRWINPPKLIDWQGQALLVCALPCLCGYKAQLLVGVECRSVEALACMNAGQLHQQITQFAATTEGKRALRSSQVPPENEVSQWISAAGETDIRNAA